MSLAEKTASIIERNADRALSLQQLAEAAGVSRAHLSRAFAAAAGLPVMAYLRGRRLSHAAVALAEGADDILQVALDAGYNSHEAFTRAFRDQFGDTPTAVRERASIAGLRLTAPLDTAGLRSRVIAPPRIVAEARIMAVGMTERIAPASAAAAIPALWRRFEPFMSAVDRPKRTTPISITRDIDDEGRYDYVAALEVEKFCDVAPELVAVDIPASTYAVFVHKGHVSRIPESYFAIWDDALPASGRTASDGPVLERHRPSFDPRTGEGGVDIWVPLEQ